MPHRLLIVLVPLLFAGTVDAKELVSDFSGNGDTVTRQFRVEGPWIIEWRLDGDYQQMLALDVSLLDAHTGRSIGRVVHTKRRGNGVRLFSESGMYQLRVTTTLGRWRLRVEQLTPEEAEGYTPRNNEPFRDAFRNQN